MHHILTFWGLPKEYKEVFLYNTSLFGLITFSNYLDHGVIVFSFYLNFKGICCTFMSSNVYHRKY